MRMRRPQGGALVTVLMLLVGIIIGLAAGIAPRLFMKLDPMKFIKPDLAYTPPPEVKPEDLVEKVHPREAELKNMIEEVKKQRAALAEREKPLVAREQEIASQLQTLTALKAKIEEAESAVKKQQVAQNGDEAVNVKKLAKIWGTMEPADSAKVMTSIEPEFAARVLYAMPAEQTAPILQVLIGKADTEKYAAELMTTYKRMKPAPKPEAR